MLLSMHNMNETGRFKFGKWQKFAKFAKIKPPKIIISYIAIN